MTRVVVPRSNASPASSASQARTTAAGGGAPTPAPAQAPHEDVETAGDTATPEAEPNESPSRSSLGVLTSRTSSLRLEDSKPEAKAGEGAKETAGPETLSGAATATATATATAASTSLEAPTGTSSSTRAPASSRRGSFTTTSRPSFATPQRARTSPTSSHSTSPRAHGGDGDGYNSADESGSWPSAAPPGYEEDEDKESQFAVELRRVKGLEVRGMVPDGNCLFRAVADQVYGDPEMYADTRQMCIDYMERERDHFSQFVTEGFTGYCKRKRRDKVYGNNLEIQAMAEMYNRPIHIYSYSTDPINIFQGQYETDSPPILLSYHRRNHYNSLHDPSRPTVGAGLGFGSLRGRNVDREQVKAAIRAQQDQQLDNALLAEGRYYSDLELTEQEIERMVMEKSRAEYLAQRQAHLIDETSSSAGGEPSSSGAASRSSGSPGGSRTGAPLNPTVDTAVSRNSNVRLLLSMGFNYVRVMEACSIFGDDVHNMLCYLLETDSLGENNSRMKGKAAEK